MIFRHLELESVYMIFILFNDEAEICRVKTKESLNQPLFREYNVSTEIV